MSEGNAQSRAAGTVTEGARVRVGLSRQNHGASYPSLTLDYSTFAAMDARDSIHDVFSTEHLWRQPSFFDDDSQESSLFAPLELDSGSSRLFIRACERVADQPQSPQSDLTILTRPNMTSNANCDCLIWTRSNLGPCLSSTVSTTIAFPSKHRP